MWRVNLALPQPWDGGGLVQEGCWTARLLPVFSNIIWDLAFYPLLIAPNAKSPISSLCELLSRSLSGLDYMAQQVFQREKVTFITAVNGEGIGAGPKLGLNRTRNDWRYSCHLISSVVIRQYLTGKAGRVAHATVNPFVLDVGALL